MNRSVVIAVALAAMALVVGVWSRTGRDAADDASLGASRSAVASRPPVAGERPAGSERNSMSARSGERMPADRRPDALGASQKNPEGGDDQRRPARDEKGSGRRRNAETIGSRDAGTGAAGAGADLGAGSRRAAGIVRDDRNFRAAAENLPDADARSERSDDHADDAVAEPADDLTHEPPETPVVDDAMSYNSGALRFSIDSPFSIPNTSDTGTVSMWMQPEWDAESTGDAAVMELGDGLFRVYRNVNVLRFEVMSDNPEFSTSLSTGEWQPGDWHSITATWDKQQVTFYVDGAPVGNPIQGSFAVEGSTPVTIGSMAPPEQISPATLSDISLRGRALSAGEIARLYDRSAVPKRLQ